MSDEERELVEAVERAQSRVHSGLTGYELVRAARELGNARYDLARYRGEETVSPLPPI